MECPVVNNESKKSNRTDTNCIDSLNNSSSHLLHSNGQQAAAGSSKNDTTEAVQLLLRATRVNLTLKNYDQVIADCQQILDICDANVCNRRVYSRFIFALFQTGKCQKAKQLALEWVKLKPVEIQAKKSLECLNVVLKTTNDRLKRLKMLTMEDDEIMIDTSVSGEVPRSADEQSSCCGLELQMERLSLRNDPPDEKVDIHTNYKCVYCNLSFDTQSELNSHCRMQNHQISIMSDEDRKWKYRNPPRGVSAEQYSLCESILNGETCRFGEQCTESHSEEELAEWKERFNYRLMKIEEARKNQLYDDVSSYTEKLMERWIQSANPADIMKESVEDVKLDVNPPKLNVSLSSKCSSKEWTFCITSSRKLLCRVALLNDFHRSHFGLISVDVILEGKKGKSQKGNSMQKLQDAQEWINKNVDSCQNETCVKYKLKLRFTTSIFGTFRQSIVFDFGEDPVLVKKICVDVISVLELDKLEQVKKTVICSTERWDLSNCEVTLFSPKPDHLSSDKMQESLQSLYMAPQTSQFVVTQAVMEPKLSADNYSNRLHELLYIEEMAQFQLLSRFNICAQMQLTSKYLITLATNSTARYSVSGELYALLKLESELSEDTAAGRLILANCHTIFLSLPQKNESTKSRSIDVSENGSSDAKIQDHNNRTKRRVFEALIEDRGKDVIYLRLSKTCVEQLELSADTKLDAEIQFQLNRMPTCEMHLAVDKMSVNVPIIFPDTSVSNVIPWNPNKQWNEFMDERLNPKQKEAIVAVTSSRDIKLPPILLVGPFGTGKTFTLAQAVKQLICQDERNRILICTHSNSAADLYIKDYLHDFCKDHPQAKPLRVIYKNRWVQTVDATVLKYSLLVRNSETGISSFKWPSLQELEDHRIVVTTLSTSLVLSQLALPRGYFTHILIDEAAQALECEAIMPLVLADEYTKIVLAGDHMQLSPEIFSQFCRDQKLPTSLLERLYDHYPHSYNCCILLCENYRSHDAIISYTSKLFYDDKLIASGKQPAHGKFYPLTFFTARGEDVQDKNSTAFYNNSEVYELVERVSDLWNFWPKSWGPKNSNSIGIVSPYYDQVVKIRVELRKRKLFGINVERVLNVQGKQFRAMFLSIVRTRYTCQASNAVGIREDDIDFGFLSNAKLLNTAVTRAQSLVAVVGDPVTLCSVGKCRKLWETFIKICHDQNSLYGITWSGLRSHLDGVEFKKSSYVLNPLAPEFVPLRYRLEPYLYLPPGYQIRPIVYRPPVIPTQGPALSPYVPQPVHSYYHPYVAPPYYPPLMSYPRQILTPSLPFPSPVAYMGNVAVSMPGYPNRMITSPRMPLNNSQSVMADGQARLGLPIVETNHLHPAVVKGQALVKKQMLAPSPENNSLVRDPKLQHVFGAAYQPVPSHLQNQPRPSLCLKQVYCLPTGNAMPPKESRPSAVLNNRWPSNHTSPSISPSSQSPRSPSSPRRQTTEMLPSSGNNCLLEVFVDAIKNYLPPNCCLKILFSSLSLQETWINYVRKFKGAVQAEEFHQHLETVKALHRQGHSFPPHIGNEPCKLCVNSQRLSTNECQNVRGSASEVFSPRRVNALNPSASGRNIPAFAGNAERNLMLPTKRNVMTVEELEASFANDATPSSVVNSVRYQAFPPNRLQDPAYHFDVLSRLLDDDGDPSNEINPSAVRSGISNNVAITDSHRVREKVPGTRSNSWTPIANEQYRSAYAAGNPDAGFVNQNPIIPRRYSLNIGDSNVRQSTNRQIAYRGGGEYFTGDATGRVETNDIEQQPMDLSAIGRPLTYAGVVRSALETRNRDGSSHSPLSIIQDLKGTSGYYHYFT